MDWARTDDIAFIAPPAIQWTCASRDKIVIMKPAIDGEKLSLDERRIRFDQQVHASAINTCKWDNTGDYLASSDQSGLIACWDTKGKIADARLDESFTVENLLAFAWYRPQTIMVSDIEMEIGPSFIFGKYAIVAISSTGKLFIRYKNGNGVFTTNEAIVWQQESIAIADICVSASTVS